jgi:catechol 2,3-dioxygenase-like lactoylglutathione lyase family enzyme
VTASAKLPRPPEQVGTAALVDVDHDGDLDIASAGAAMQLLRNNGDGSFTDITADAGLTAGTPGEFGGVMLGLNVESEELVDAVLADAVAAGATLISEPVRADWGGYRGYFADPDGHPWEVLYHPYLAFAEDGSLRTD